MAEIRWTSEAETWLRDIYNYIAADNPDAAIILGVFHGALDLDRYLKLV